jgi:hypothetical protein
MLLPVGIEDARAVAKESFSRRRNGADSPYTPLIFGSFVKAAWECCPQTRRRPNTLSLSLPLANQIGRCVGCPNRCRLNVDTIEVVCVCGRPWSNARTLRERAWRASVERAIVQARLARKTPAKSDSESCGTQISPVTRIIFKTPDLITYMHCCWSVWIPRFAVP